MSQLCGESNPIGSKGKNPCNGDGLCYHIFVDKKMALIVDDETDIIEHVGSILRKSGLNVVSSSIGEDGLRLAFGSTPQIILSDIFLPGIDGGEVAHRLSENAKIKDISIIYLTGLVTEEESIGPEKIGRSFVIAKPVLKRELLSTIEKVLN